MALILADYPLDILPALNGQEALALAETHSDIALILMDIQMPQMDGYEATKAILALPQHINTPIIAMTAHVSEEDTQKCLRAGMQNTLTKPIDSEALLTTLREYIKQATF